ncbi:MAG: hypothetical protein ACLU0Y_09185 [Hominilimicola sp.]
MNSDNLVGITLGNRYDMLEKIGTGGMATVYKAKDTLLNRYVDKYFVFRGRTGCFKLYKRGSVIGKFGTQ